MDGLRVLVKGVVVCACALMQVRLEDFTEPGGIRAEDVSAPATGNGGRPVTAPPVAMPPIWRWQATISPAAGNPDWKFGSAVAIHENAIAVGPACDWDLGIDQGGVQLCRLVGGRWVQGAALAHPAGDVHSRFGACVSMANRMLLVGAPRDSEAGPENGAAFLYRQVDDEWQLEASLRGADSAGGQFGAAVACDEQTLVIGAPRSNQGAVDSGAVEVFERVGNDWHRAATLAADPSSAGALFGVSVALDAGRIIVGAPGDRGDGTWSGRAFIFTRGPGGWSLEAVLSCPMTGRGWFGNAVAVCGDRAIVGAPRLVRPNQTDFDARGTVFEFRRIGDRWLLASAIMPPNPLEGDSFGCSVAMDQQHAVFGASSDSLAGRLAGAAFAGSRAARHQWTVERLPAPDASQQQLAGHAVAIFGRHIVVGRLGNQEEDPVPGAVSVFEAAHAPADQPEAMTASSARSGADP